MNEDIKKEILELHKKQLFTEVLTALMRTEYEEITGEEVVRIAMGAVASFAKREGVRLEWIISDTRFCVDCGKRLNNNSRCPKCGHETDTQDECYEWDCEYVRQNGECQKCRNDFEGEPRW